MKPDIISELYPQFAPKPSILRYKWLIPAVLFLVSMILLFSCDHEWARADVVSIAQSQVGLGEMGGNNRGIYVRQYLNGKDGLPWCAGFVSYCVKQAGYSLPYYLQAKSYLKLGNKIERWNLSPNDIVVFSRKGGGHIGIIEQVVKNGFTSIEGNVGEYPARVKRVKHMFEDSGILGFVRLAKGQ